MPQSEFSLSRDGDASREENFICPPFPERIGWSEFMPGQKE